MERCESKTGGICTRPAIWKQSVHAGNREAGRLLYHSYWCDEHAQRVADHRRRDKLPPAEMTRIVQDEA
jgi:hypothetical protein